MNKRVYLFVIIILINIYLLNKISKIEFGKVRICCLVLTSPKFYNSRARVIYETWGSRCDKLFFISELSSITTDLPIAPIKNLKEGYQYLSLKSILAFKFIYENYFSNFDWFLKTDDDTFIIMENLKTFLKDKNSLLPVTYGYDYRVGMFLFSVYLKII